MSRQGRQPDQFDAAASHIERRLDAMPERQRDAAWLTDLRDVPAELRTAVAQGPDLVLAEKRALNRAKRELERKRPRMAHFDTAIAEADAAIAAQEAIAADVRSYVAKAA